MNWQDDETAEQEERTRAAVDQVIKRRIRNAEHARLIEDRETLRYHAQKAKELYGTSQGADHAASAAQLAERITERFNLDGYDVGEGASAPGGEIVPVEDRNADSSFYVPTLPYDVGELLGDEDLVRRSASRDRIDMLVQADALALGVETAESTGARDAVEKMLAHEMATAHKLGMDFASKANLMLSSVQTWQTDARQQTQSIEAARLSNTSVKLMKAFTDAAETLHKLRGGAPQRIIVQHVHQQVQVNEGGQAVVNGTAQTGTALPGDGGRK